MVGDLYKHAFDHADVSIKGTIQSTAGKASAQKFTRVDDIMRT